MTTTNGGAFTVAQRENNVQSDKTVMINARYTTAAGTEAATKTILIPSDGSLTRLMGGAVLDSPAPQSILDARDAYLNVCQSYIDSLAAAGKLEI